MSIKACVLTAFFGASGTTVVVAPILGEFGTQYLDSWVNEIKEAADSVHLENSKLKTQRDNLEKDKARLKREKKKAEEQKKEAEQSKLRAEQESEQAKLEAKKAEDNNRQLQTSQVESWHTKTRVESDLKQLKAKVDAQLEKAVMDRLTDFTSGSNQEKLYVLLEDQMGSEEQILTLKMKGWWCKNTTWTESEGTKGIAYCILPPENK